MIGRTLRALVTPKFSLKRLGSYRLAYSTIKNADPNADYIMFKDDLWYDHKHKANYSEVVRVIRNDASRTYNERAVAYILYNMGVAGTEDLIMMDFLERWLDKYRGKFTGRFIFGAFDGALRVNMKSQYTRMFLEDYQKHKPVLTPFEYTRLLDSLAHNSILPKEERVMLGSELFEPLILAKWKKIRFIRPVVHTLLLALTRLNRLDSDLGKKVIEMYAYAKVMNLERLVEAYHVLSEAVNDVREGFMKGEGGEVAKGALEVVKKTISGKEFRWTFDVKEIRQKTYDELFAARDTIRFPNQYFPIGLREDRRASWERIKQEGIDAERRRLTGEDKENIAERMSDSQLLDLVASGGVVMETIDMSVDEAAQAQILKDEEEIRKGTDGSN